MEKMTGWLSDPDAAARFYARHYPGEARDTLALADEICQNTFTFRGHWEMERTHEPVSFPEGIVWDRVPAGDPEWVYAFSRHTFQVTLGRAYRLSGDPRYAEQFARLALDFMARAPLTPESEQTTWRSIEAGIRCESYLKALELFSGSAALTPSLTDRIDGFLAAHGAYLMRASGVFQRLSNWGVLQDHGLLLTGIYLGNDAYVQTALRRLSAELSLQVMDDGTHWEQSPMYHCEVLHCAMDSVLIARRNGVAVPDALDRRVHAMARALCAWVKSDGRIPCQSDSDDTDARDLLCEAALLYQDGLLRARASGRLPAEAVWNLGAGAQQELNALVPLPADHPSDALPDSGNYMLRSGLGAGAVNLRFHCGCMGSGHGHADTLHVSLSAGGEDILIDPGRYTYVDSPLRLSLKSPAAHNVTLLDGLPFTECTATWEYGRIAPSVKGQHKFTPSADYVCGAHLGYPGAFVSRKVVFLRAGLFVLFDAFHAPGRHAAEQRFHFNPDGIVSLEDGVARYRGRRTQAALQFPGADALSLGTFPCSREYNRLEEGALLTASRAFEGLGSMLCVGSVGNEAPQVRKLPVARLRLPSPVPETLAEAVEIRASGERYVVLCCHGECFSGVELFDVGGFSGYGQVIVFSDENPEGTVLAW